MEECIICRCSVVEYIYCKYCKSCFCPVCISMYMKNVGINKCCYCTNQFEISSLLILMNNSVIKTNIINNLCKQNLLILDCNDELVNIFTILRKINKSKIEIDEDRCIYKYFENYSYFYELIDPFSTVKFDEKVKVPKQIISYKLYRYICKSMKMERIGNQFRLEVRNGNLLENILKNNGYKFISKCLEIENKSTKKEITLNPIHYHGLLTCPYCKMIMFMNKVDIPKYFHCSRCLKLFMKIDKEYFQELHNFDLSRDKLLMFGGVNNVIENIEKINQKLNVSNFVEKNSKFSTSYLFKLFQLSISMINSTLEKYNDNEYIQRTINDFYIYKFLGIESDIFRYLEKLKVDQLVIFKELIKNKQLEFSKYLFRETYKYRFIKNVSRDVVEQIEKLLMEISKHFQDIYLFNNYFDLNYIFKYI